MADLQDALRLLRRGDDLLAVGDGAGHRLFEEDVLAGFERGDRRLGVLVPHGDDRDGVDLGVGEQLAVVGEGLLHAEFLGELGEPAFGARAERRKLEVRDADDRLAMDLAEPAEPDDADAQPVQSVLPPQKSSSVSSRAITMLPAVSPQSTGSTTPVIADAASEARKATARITSIGSTMRPSGYQRVQLLSTSGLRVDALVPDRRPHRARADDVDADVVAAELHAPATA